MTGLVRFLMIFYALNVTNFQPVEIKPLPVSINSSCADKPYLNLKDFILHSNEEYELNPQVSKDTKHIRVTFFEKCA